MNIHEINIEIDRSSFVNCDKKNRGRWREINTEISMVTWMSKPEKSNYTNHTNQTNYNTGWTTKRKEVEWEFHPVIISIILLIPIVPQENCIEGLPDITTHGTKLDCWEAKHEMLDSTTYQISYQLITIRNTIRYRLNSKLSVICVV